MKQADAGGVFSYRRAYGVRTDEDAFRGEDTTGITAENPPVL